MWTSWWRCFGIVVRVDLSAKSRVKDFKANAFALVAERGDNRWNYYLVIVEREYTATRKWFKKIHCLSDNCHHIWFTCKNFIFVESARDKRTQWNKRSDMKYSKAIWATERSWEGELRQIDTASGYFGKKVCLCRQNLRVDKSRLY